MYFRSAILVATSSLLVCVKLTQGFMPAPPTIQSSKSVSAHVAEPMATPMNAVMKGGQPANSDKPKLKLPNTCDSDYECDGTEFCCDFMFFKMCCNDGWRAKEEWVPVPIPIPIPIDPYYGRGGDYGGRGGDYSGRGGDYGGYR